MDRETLMLKKTIPIRIPTADGHEEIVECPILDKMPAIGTCGLKYLHAIEMLSAYEQAACIVDEEAFAPYSGEYARIFRLRYWNTKDYLMLEDTPSNGMEELPPEYVCILPKFGVSSFYGPNPEVGYDDYAPKWIGEYFAELPQSEEAAERFASVFQDHGDHICFTALSNDEFAGFFYGEPA